MRVKFFLLTFDRSRFFKYTVIYFIIYFVCINFFPNTCLIYLGLLPLVIVFGISQLSYLYQKKTEQYLKNFAKVGIASSIIVFVLIIYYMDCNL